MHSPLPKVALALLALFASSCRATGPGVLPPELLDDIPVSERVFAVLWPGDVLEVRHRRTPELDAVVTVRPDGLVDLPLAGSLAAAGRTPEELVLEIERRCSLEVRDPEVTVIVTEFAGRTIHVGGEVEEPGNFQITRATSLLEALILAGGPRASAHMDGVLLLRSFAEGQWRAFEIDANSILAGAAEARNVRLLPSDIVYVPRSPIANVNLWVDQYIRQNLPFSVSIRPDIGVDG